MDWDISFGQSKPKPYPVQASQCTGFPESQFSGSIKRYGKFKPDVCLRHLKRG